MKCLSSSTDVLHRPLILIVSSCCCAEDGTEMYQHVKCTCKALLFLLMKPIAFKRSRYRCCPPCLTSLMNKTVKLYVQNIIWLVSSSSSGKQQREIAFSMFCSNVVQCDVKFSLKNS